MMRGSYCVVCGLQGGSRLSEGDHKRLREVAEVLGGALKNITHTHVHRNCHMRALAWAHWKKAKLEKESGEN